MYSIHFLPTSMPKVSSKTNKLDWQHIKKNMLAVKPPVTT